MSRPTWDDYFTGLLPVIKSRASCPRGERGALIVDGINRLISTGYNGPPSPLPNCTETPCPGTREVSGDTRLCIALHAEHNAIHFAGDKIDGAATMYCTTKPCTKCSLEILQTPIKRVVYLEDYADDYGRLLLEKGGVQLEQYVKNIQKVDVATKN